MTCNSAIHTVNSTNATVTTTNPAYVQVPFGSVIRRFGRNLRLDGGSIVAQGSGYFEVNACVNVTSTAAGPIAVQLRQDGVPVPGTTVEVQGAVDEPTVLPIDCLVRNCGCDCNSVLTLWVNAPCTLTNVSTVVEKL